MLSTNIPFSLKTTFRGYHRPNFWVMEVIKPLSVAELRFETGLPDSKGLPPPIMQELIEHWRHYKNFDHVQGRKSI